LTFSLLLVEVLAVRIMQEMEEVVEQEA